MVLAGDGPSFCAGADIEWMRQSVDLTYEENVADANALRRMLDAIDTLPGAGDRRVQGHAIGGGAGLVARPTSRSPTSEPCSGSPRSSSGSPPR